MCQIFFFPQRRQNLGSAYITLVFWYLNYLCLFYRLARLTEYHKGSGHRCSGMLTRRRVLISRRRLGTTLAPSSSVEDSLTLENGTCVVPKRRLETSTLRCVMSQKSAGLPHRFLRFCIVLLTTALLSFLFRVPLEVNVDGVSGHLHAFFSCKD